MADRERKLYAPELTINNKLEITDKISEIDPTYTKNIRISGNMSIRKSDKDNVLASRKRIAIDIFNKTDNRYIYSEPPTNWNPETGDWDFNKPAQTGKEYIFEVRATVHEAWAEIEVQVEGDQKTTKWHDPVDNPQITIYMQSGGDDPGWASFGNVRNSRVHHGIDFFAIKGTNIYACLDAFVVGVETQRGYGKILILKVKNIDDFNKSRLDYKLNYKNKGEVEGISTSGEAYLRYAHLDTTIVKVGQEVTSGKVVGTTGTSGIDGGTCGPHLHFEISSSKYPSGFTQRYNPGYYVCYKTPQTMSDNEKEIQKKRKNEGQK